MNQSLGNISILVRDYDEAIAYYTNVLKFQLLEDTELSPIKRWVRVAPQGKSSGTALLLAKASTPEQEKQIGYQTGGRVFLFLYTDNIERDYQNLIDNSVKIIRPLEDQPWGKVTVFADLYGNLWDLIESNK